MKRRNLPDLDSALADFEALLNNDQKKKEKPLLDKAHETQRQLRLEGMFLMQTKSFTIENPRNPNIWHKKTLNLSSNKPVLCHFGLLNRCVDLIILIFPAVFLQLHTPENF